MPRLTDARRQEIRTAIRAGRKPTRGTSNRTILATGAGPNRRQNKYVVLADGAGKLTQAGAFYYETTGVERPRAAFDQDQDLTRGEGMTTFGRETAGRRSSGACAQTGPPELPSWGGLFFVTGIASMWCTSL